MYFGLVKGTKDSIMTLKDIKFGLKFLKILNKNKASILVVVVVTSGVHFIRPYYNSLNP